MAQRRRRRAGAVLNAEAAAPVGFDWRPSDVELGRRALRGRRARRSALTAAASTVAFAGVASLLVVNAPGWEAARDRFLDPVTAWEVLPDLLTGLWLNLRVLAVAVVLVPAIGLAVALLRTLRGPIALPLRLFALLYVDVFRGLPLLVTLYLVGFGLPALRIEGFDPPTAVLGGAAVILTYGAYVAEVFRSGIQAVHPSQVLAARSLGLSYPQTVLRVVLPQALRRVTPALLNDLVALQKDVGLISVLGAVDAVRSAQIEVSRSFDFTPYVVAGLLFVALSVPTARLADWAAARATAREQAGAGL